MHVLGLVLAATSTNERQQPIAPQHTVLCSSARQSWLGGKTAITITAAFAVRAINSSGFH